MQNQTMGFGRLAREWLGGSLSVGGQDDFSMSFSEGFEVSEVDMMTSWFNFYASGLGLNVIELRNGYKVILTMGTMEQ